MIYKKFIIILGKNKIEDMIEMKDKDKIIRVKLIRYNPEYQEKFKKQIKELIELKLIRYNRSPHISPAFMSINHSDIARGKAIMVINYKKTK